ncbi:MAG: FAD-dependent oxidoreductase, partial [Nitrospinota bacterium]
MYFDVVVLGGGPSGLMCALTAGKRGRSVLVVEHNKSFGKKLLISGGGRSNFTNLFVEPHNFISSNPHFCKSALRRFSQWDFIAMLETHGISYHEPEHGQLFCDNSSVQILEMLLYECKNTGVTFRSLTTVKGVEP